MRDMKFFRYLPVDDKHHAKGEEHGADGKKADYIIMLQRGIFGRLNLSAKQVSKLACED